MGKIYIVHDLSPSQPWVHPFLLANRGSLAAQGIEIGPFVPSDCEITPSHAPLWEICAVGQSLPPVQASLWNRIAAALGRKKDVLLFAGVPFLAAHDSFARLLKQKIDLAAHTVKMLFIISNPVFTFEQRLREAHLSREEAQKYAEAYARIPELISHARASFGDGNINVIVNAQQSAKAEPLANIGAQALSFLDCEEQAQYPDIPIDPLYLDSRAARRLAQVHEVRFNTWPPLDERSYMSVLQKLDCAWGRDLESIRFQRLWLARESAEWHGEVERIHCLEAGTLAAPDWLLAEKGDDGARMADKFRQFAQALPEDTAAVLRKRLSNDSHLLSQDQKLLQSFLPAETGIIGEPEPPVELAVLTMAYNHERFIAECMDSVLAQKTDFPVRHIVMDHCSLDSTQDIIRAYAVKHPSITPVLLSHHRPLENVTGLFLRCRTKYAALCDGDDYFTDPLKLQKQVDFLENNPTAAICFHPVSVEFEDGSPSFIYPPPGTLPRGENSWHYLSDLFKGNFIQTNSVVYRWRFRDGLPAWFVADMCPGDWYWHLLHAETGKIGCLPEVMSVYRRHSKALYSSAFKDTLAHRRLNGMSELHVYQVCNAHFQGRYFEQLSSLANGVFADFFNLAQKERDDRLLNSALEKFPEFGARFYKELLRISSGQEENPGKKARKSSHERQGA